MVLVTSLPFTSTVFILLATSRIHLVIRSDIAPFFEMRPWIVAMIAPVYPH